MDATARETFLLAAIAYAEALAEVARSEERGDVRPTRAALLDHADAAYRQLLQALELPYRAAPTVAGAANDAGPTGRHP